MEEEKELDLRYILDIFKKRIWLIVIITLLTTVTSAIVSLFFISPTYEATVGIIIGKQSDGEKITNSDVTMYQNLMQTYKNIAETNFVAEIAADRIGEGLKSNDLLDKTTVTAKTGTMILNITVESNVAADSVRKVQAYTDVFMQRAKELIPEGDVKIMDSPQLPESPVKPNKIVNIIIGFLSGLFISVGIAFLLEYMNNTIVTKEDIEKYLNLSVIGIIPENNLE